MSFTKITQAQLNARGATTLDNKPTISATALKTEFDAPAKQVVAPAVNNLIDELEDTSASSSIGATVPSGLPSGTSANVQSVLDAINTSVSTAVTNSHTHSNKDVLDDITADDDHLVYDDNEIALSSDLDTKVDKVTGKGLSTNDYTNDEKTKLEGIEANANNYELPVATTSSLGGVKPDGTTITVDSNGKISAVGGGGGGSSVAWSQYVSSGTKIAQINIDGTKTDVYAPTSGGGGGGVTSYAALDDKPSINDNELNGNMSASELGLATTSEVNAKYTKPSSGIPKTDLASAVQTSLGKADSAYQKPSGGIPESDLDSNTTAKLSALDYTSSDSGKALKVKEDGSALEWGESGSDEFIGTTSQWNAISDKQKYIGKVVNITDDYNEPIASGSLTDAYGETDVWASGQSYTVDDYVIDDGKLFKCIVAHTSSAEHEPISDSTHWERISLKSLKEDDGKIHVGDRIYLAINKSANGCAMAIRGFTTTTSSGTYPRGFISVSQPIGDDVQGAVIRGKASFAIKSHTAQCGVVIDNSWGAVVGKYDINIYINSENVSYGTMPSDAVIIMSLSGATGQPTDYSDLYIEFI